MRQVHYSLEKYPLRAPVCSPIKRLTAAMLPQTYGARVHLCLLKAHENLPYAQSQNTCLKLLISKP